MPATAIPAESLRLTLAEALADLLDAYEVAGRSPHTLTLFRTHVGRLIAFLAQDGIVSLDGVTTAHVTRFLAHERKRGLKPASLSVSLRTLRRFFQWAVEQGHLAGNPARSVMAPTVTVEPVKFLSSDDLDRLLTCIAKDKTLEGVRDTAFVRVLMDTGLRRGEVIGLRVTDVSDDLRLLTVRGATSKTRHGRTVTVGRVTANALRTYLRVRTAYLARNGRSGEAALWVGAKGVMSDNGALQMFHRRLEAAGLPKRSLHSLRHGWAAGLVADGVPMPYIVSLGGWANAAMPTNRYGQHGVAGRAIEAMQKHLDR